MKRLFILGMAFVFGMVPQLVRAVCSTAVPSAACTDDSAMNFDEVIMCFNTIDFLKDNGSCAGDKSALSCWDRDRLVTGPFEADVMDLGAGLDLASLGATAGSLSSSTSYPCQIADVESIILGTAGNRCDATAMIGGEGSFPSDFLQNMVIRGIDACPGTTEYPPGLPVQTTAETAASFKFNVQFGSSGAPLFIFKPLSGATLDTSNVTTIQATATGAQASGNVYCGIFKNTDPQQGGGPDAGGGQGSVASGTATCTINGSPGDYNAVGMFQDVDSSGADQGPDGDDLICLSTSFSATAGATTTVDCGAFVSFSSLQGGA